MPIPIGYHEAIVSPRTSRAVEAYWSFSAEKAGTSLILPDGRCDVIVRYNMSCSSSPIPIITGPATQPYTVEYDVGDSWLGVRLRPGSAVNLWRQRTFHAADTVLRGEDAFAVLPDLSNVKDVNLTLDNLSATLEPIAKALCDSRVIRALDVLHSSGGRVRIEKLATYAGCTSRQLQRIFRSSSGLSTKTYAQLVQFHRTLKLIDLERLGISDAAVEGGYSDHAHLTRAFQRFGGFAPTRIPAGISLPSLFS